MYDRCQSIKINSKFDYFKLIILYKKLKSVFVGDVLSKFQFYLLKSLSNIYSFTINLIEDGTSLHIDQHEIIKKINKFNLKYAYGFYRSQKFEVCKFIKISYPNIINQISFSSSLTNYQELNNFSTIILGTNAFDYYKISRKNYESKIRSQINKEKVAYFPHRNEKIVNFDNFKIFKTYGIDFLILKGMLLKFNFDFKHIISAPSTSILLLADFGLFKNCRLTLIDIRNNDNHRLDIMHDFFINELNHKKVNFDVL